MKFVKKILIKPTKAQKETFDFWLRRCCQLYNIALQQKIWYYKSTGRSLNVYEQKKELTLIKQEDKSWSDVPNKSLTDVLFRLDKSYSNFFNRGCNGFPKFKSKYRFNSIYFVREDVRIKSDKLFLPKIKSNIKFGETIPKEYSSIILIKEKNKYYLSFTYEQEIKPLNLNIKDNIGVDLGLKSLFTDTKGFKQNRFSLKLFNRYQKRIKQLNKSLSRKQKGSIRFKKIKTQLGKAHSRLSNTRKDFLHKVSREYINSNLENRLIVGDIEINKIVQSSYTIKNANKEGKRGIRKNFYNSSLSMLKLMLAYKGIKSGIPIEYVNERNTSKACSCCGHMNYDLKLSDRVYRCTECKTDIDRDLNGAINIRNVWLGQFKPKIPVVKLAG